MAVTVPPTPPGAVVDPETAPRAAGLGRNLRDCLAYNDASRFF